VDTADAWTDSFSAPAPVLIAADSETARARAARTVAASGLRIADSVGLAGASERIGLQVSASALWLELDADGGITMDALLAQVNADAAYGRYGTVVSAPVALLDPITARLTDGSIQIVIDGNDAERAAALALALSGADRPERLSDVAADRNSERLRQLSDEVGRIAATLARLSTGPGAPPEKAKTPDVSAVPDVPLETVRSIIRARRLRSRFFAEDLFADPAWDMLLDLLQAEIAQLRVPVSSLCIAAAVPATTALRWLKSMTDQGIFVRRSDPHDGRRVFVELSRDASASMRRYFAELGTVAVV
jgi:DNA-binding MarR family transcriptional regulator